jgi:EmrB/QacA subfamily drug resistance transporter
MTDAAAADSPTLHLNARERLEILGAILLAMFLFALDQTVVGTALPRIVTDLHGDNLYTWAVTIYLLTSTVSGPIYGKLSDLFGRRPIIIWAVGLFLVSSIFAGLSQEMWQLIVFRGLQGLGGGAVFPVALAVVADLYTPAERGKYLGLFGAVFGLSSLLGPGIGGFITDTFTWHWIFFVNVPIALVSLVILWRLLPPIRRPDAARHIDYLGAAVFTGAISPFLIGLSNKTGTHLVNGAPVANDWIDPAVGGLMLLGVVIGVAFLWIESRVEEPIVRLDLFRNRSFTVSVASMFLAAFGFFGAIIFLPRWFQVVAGASATESGYNLLPILGALIISATASGQIVARTHRYKALIFVAMILLATGLFLLTNLRADTDRATLWLWMIIAGLGIGPSFAVFTLVVQNTVAPQVIGVATASLTFFQQIGGTIGLTIAGTVLADRLTSELPPRLLAAGVPAPFLSQFGQGGQFDLTGTGDLGARILAATPEAARPQVQPLIDGIVRAVHESFSIAIASTFWVSIVAAIVAAVFVLFLNEAPMRSTFEMAPEDREPASGAGQGVRSGAG